MIQGKVVAKLSGKRSPNSAHTQAINLTPNEMKERDRERERVDEWM